MELSDQTSLECHPTSSAAASCRERYNVLVPTLKGILLFTDERRVANFVWLRAAVAFLLAFPNVKHPTGSPSMSDVRRFALVTGASSRIGTACAGHFASCGYNLILVAPREVRLDTIARRIQKAEGCYVDTCVADLSSSAGLATIAQLLGERDDIDVFVNSTCLGGPEGIASINADATEHLTSINMLACIQLSHAARSGFRRRGYGTLVNIAA